MTVKMQKVKKEDNLIEWYNNVLIESEIVDFSAVKGFAVYRPYGYEMWEIMKEFLDKRFKSFGVKNSYFPLLIPEKMLNKEEDHIKGFSVEVAWVTKGGDKDLDEKLAIRPTSETIMYDSYSKWIKSYRDLPLLLNQWNTMVRWETKETRFLLRSREVLWQEGHCAFASEEEAMKNVMNALSSYEAVMQELLAVPVILGRKSEGEKFAGAVSTYTVETILSNNFASQAATSHYLGQNFSKPFEIKFLDEKNEWKYAYQTSWGTAMRDIGIMILIHGDDKGLVLPPKIAPIQVVIIPIINGGKDDKNILESCNEVYRILEKMGIRTLLDSRTEYSAGWKFNEYDLKGVPVKLEIGNREVESDSFSVKIRFSGKKETLKMQDLKDIPQILEQIQKDMFNRAKKEMNSRIVEEKDREKFISILKESSAVVKSAWCDNQKCEENIKEETGATSRLIPIEKEELIDKKCVFCGKNAKVNAYFAKSY
ncbi:MAG: proline--tRNA ligase [Candidatus Parvarchaeota archaeon]|nr:proline--tRNA ligase [Candidatus Parvarchaeota archaeon]